MVIKSAQYPVAVVVVLGYEYWLFVKRREVTLVFQLEDTIRLFGTLLLLDAIHFPKSDPCIIFGSVCQIGALLGTSLYACINQHLLYRPRHPCLLFGTIHEASGDPTPVPYIPHPSCNWNSRVPLAIVGKVG